LLEVDMEPAVYDEEHIPNAVKLDWETDLAGELGRNIVGPDAFEELVGSLGITNETTVVVYGDKANWFAAHAYWLFTYYGHDDVRLMDGGRHYWLWEDYPTTTEEPSFSAREYDASEPDESVRAYKEEVLDAIERDTSIIDVRNPKEYRGESPPADIPNTTERQGHIPTAENVPWGETVSMDGTFKSEAELREIYSDVISDEGTIAYCRIGERSSLTWFVLHELLGQDAANYDGSWTEWADDEDTPVEREVEQRDQEPPMQGGD
jgi:thiosulfate/3-mercaptopyruvate sulfurtransferase